MNSALSPRKARKKFRHENVTTTAGYAAGFAQANLIAIPSKYAFDFLLFAQRNPKPCPILGVLEAGQTDSELLPGGDIRTDIPEYRVYRDGELVEETTDVTPILGRRHGGVPDRVLLHIRIRAD